MQVDNKELADKRFDQSEFCKYTPPKKTDSNGSKKKGGNKK